MRFAVVLLLLAACVDTGPGPQARVDQKYVRAHLIAEVPADIDRFDVELGKGEVIYLGNKLDRARVVPGQALSIKHYWKVVRSVGPRWRPFALVRGPKGTADFMNLELTDMQSAYPPAKWRPGDIIEDEQPITMRPDWTSPYAFLYVGFIEVGKHTTLDRMPVHGARTEDRAIVAAKLEVDLSRAPPPLGTIHIPRAAGPITIDGLAMDQGWTNALTSPEFVAGDGSGDPPGKATAKITWDDSNLYLFVSVVDPDIVTTFANHDDSLWKADVIEIFIDADGNRAGYVELQVNPRNATFDSWFAGVRGSPGDVPWDSGMQTKVNLRGTAEPSDTDQGWDAEIAIPWSAIKGRDEHMSINTPPKLGDRWKLNVNRGDIATGGKQTMSSWNRIPMGDWHALDRMLTAVFADPTGSTVPSAEALAPTPTVDAGAGSAPTPPPPQIGSGGPSPGIGSSAPGSGASMPIAPGAGRGSGGGSGGGSGRGPASQPIAKPPAPPPPPPTSKPPTQPPASAASGSGNTGIIR